MNPEKLQSVFINNLFVTCLLLAAPMIFAQPFQIGHTTITFTDASRDNRQVETQIYYPADNSGNEVPVVTSNTEQFPVLSFGHGFVMGYDAYQYLWEELVPQGFIMAFPTTEGGILPSHSEYGKDLAFVISSMSALGLSEVSPFFGRISNVNAVMGHSMGGGAAFLAAANDNQVGALVVLAPAETNPSAIVAAGTLSIPSLIIAGANDCVTPPAANQQPMYNALQSECKTYISIIGGSHCQMADTNFLCGIGEITCSPSPEIDREAQHAVIISYLTKWLQAQLRGNCEMDVNFDDQIIVDTAITFEKTCMLCAPLANVEFSNNSTEVYPNPFAEIINVASHDHSVKTIAVYDIYSRSITERTFTDTVLLNSEKWNSGFYLYTIIRDGEIIAAGKLVKK